MRLDNPPRVDKSFSEVFDDVKFIPLQSGQQNYLSFVNDVLYFRGNYFIKDNTQQSIFCFDDQGKFKFKVSPRGKGPLKLNDITDYTVNTKEGTLEVFDFGLGKIVSFDLWGNPKREKRFNYYLSEFARESNGDYVVYAPDQLNDKTADTIAPGAFVTDSTGHPVYLNMADHSQLYFSSMLNNLFVMPVIIPYFYKDSETMIGFLTAADLKKLDEYLKQAGSLKVDRQLVSQLQAIARTVTEKDNPVLITMHLKY